MLIIFKNKTFANAIELRCTGVYRHWDRIIPYTSSKFFTELSKLQIYKKLIQNDNKKSKVENNTVYIKIVENNTIHLNSIFSFEEVIYVLIIVLICVNAYRILFKFIFL